MARADDFAARRNELAELSDEQLKERFWQLAREVAEPLLELAKTHTSPSIERSVLLRMGFSSLESQAIAAKCLEHGLLGKGAGHVVWRISRLKGIPLREAGLGLAGDKYWDEAKAWFAGRQRE